MKKILQQGHFDGFCLLYAVANAFKTLKYPTKTANRFVENQNYIWTKLIMVTPSLHNFASGEGSSFGASTNQTDIILHERFLELCAAVVSERKKENFIVRRIALKDILGGVAKKSVVLLCFRSKVRTQRCSIGDHWVCVVDVDDKNLLLACSYTDYLDEQRKSSGEKVSNHLKRPFNNLIAQNEINKETVFENSLYCFEMIDD
jgi:hypothetical protein